MSKRGIVVAMATGAVLTGSGIVATAADAAERASEIRQPNVLVADADTRVQQSVLALVNEQRRSRGCPQLYLDDRLMEAARDHAAEMANNRFFAHDSLGGDTAGERVQGSGYAWSRYAENIAFGQDNPDAVVDAWLDSPRHRDNILDCALREVGVGLAFDTDHTPYWVQDFGTPQ
jgi:uncharacterized protein YkwD